MAQRHDIVTINFQANARGANAALESLRIECDKANTKVEQLKKQLKGEIQANIPADKIEKTRQDLAAATKEARQFNGAFKELTKGMATLDKGIEAFNNGSLRQMSAAFQKAVFNAAKLTRLRLDPLSETYKRDKAELTALMDASQQYYARLQADSAQVIKTIKEGGKVSRQAINDELTAHRELLQVLAEDDAGYQRTIRNIAILEQRQREMGGNYAYIRQNIKDTQKVSDETLRSMYAELEKTNQEGKVTQDIIRQNAAAMREIRAEQGRRVQNVLGGDLSKQSEGSIRSAIANAKELIQIYGSTSKKAQELAAQIVNAEEHLKTTGVEGERAARKQAEAVKLLADKHKMMQDRVKNLSSLSASALAETQKYWQAQMDGAEKASTAYRKAEKNLKAINAEMQRQATAQLQTSAGKLSRKNLGTLSEQELQTSIAAAKQLAASMKPTDAAYKQLVDDIVRAEEHVKQFGLEGQRSARQTADQMKVMEDRMKNVKTLSNSALEETRRFWQAQMDGAQRGSQAYKQAEANLKQLTAEQQRLVNEQNKTQANKLMAGPSTLSGMGAGEIQKAIEAAKQYQLTLKADSQAYKDLSVAIVNAEEHVKKYGVEAERAARKEIEAAKKAADERRKTDQLMRDQLRQGASLSQSALKAQEQYWQRLIDDPKTAAASLQEYKARLQEVQGLQRQQKREVGRDIMTQFQRDPDLANKLSAENLKKYTDALKAYRDTLPKQGNADRIKEIDAVLQKCGASAEKAAQQTLSFKQAMQVSAQAGKGQFKGTVEQLTQAKKTLEDMSAKAVKGGLAWRRMQEALQRIELELKNVGHLSQEVQAVLDQPKGKSFNALKQAVEQGRAALNNMDRTTKEGQRQFDELAKKIKACDYEMKQLAGTAKGSATAFEKAWSRLKTYITLYMGAAVAIQKITAAFGDMMTLSDKIGEVRKTTGWAADEAGRLSDTLAKMDTRTALQDLMSISARGGQLGLKSQEEIQGFTEAANQLMVALPEMGEQAATTLMKISKATGDLQRNDNDVRETLERVGSTIIALRANSASAAPAITDFVSRVGAVGAQAGITIDQIAALGSTVDALGGRVEMSATALSRMIPAIKNNSFEVAQAIGVTEKYLKSLSGMDQMVLVFRKLHDSVKNFDTSTEEGMNAAADAVEGMLGRSVSMQDAMKQLNQQGARAGIVFGLLSQNVDELEKQLGIASKAYEKNTALLNEYNNMNETTAAKWERLKNQFEEMLVSDSMQRFIGEIITALRGLVDFISGNVTGAVQALHIAVISLATGFGVLKIGLGEALLGMGNLAKAFTNLRITVGLAIGDMGRYIALKWALVRAHDEEAKAAIRAKLATMGATKAMMANVVLAFVAALGMLAWKLYEAGKAAKEAAAETGRFNQQIADEQKALNELFKPLDKSNTAQEERLRLINEINSKYGKYLGYMLSETSSAIALADAHALIAKRIKEEAYQRRIAEQEQKIQESHSEDVNAAYTKITERVRGNERGGASAQEIADILKGIVDNRMGEIKYAYDDSGNIFKARTNYYLDPKIKQAIDGGIERLVADGKLSRDNVTLIQKAVYKYTVEAKSQHDEIMSQTANLRSDLRGVQSAIKVDLANNINTLVSKVASTVGNAVRNIRQQQQPQQNVPLMLQQPQGQGSGLPSLFGGGQQGGGTSWQLPWQQQRQTTPEQQMAPKGWKPNIDKKDTEAVRQFVQDQEALRSALQASGEQIDEAQRRVAESWLLTDAELKEYKDIVKKADRAGGGGGGNVYGDYDKVKSAYSEWNGNDLVARRKEMLERVKALANGADVQAVLSEDAKFISEAVRKNIKTTEQAIEWYNTERLKIQEALKAKHLTPTGDWLDPKSKSARNAARMVKDDMKYYLDELDAYYTERNQVIQQKRNDEEITEGEAWRQTIQNETEWYQRRAALQKLYTDKSKEVTQETQDAIFDIITERTGDTAKYIRANIGQTVNFIEAIGREKSVAAMKRIKGDLDLDIEKDTLKSVKSVGKSVKFMADTLAKERPLNGIVEDLELTLTKMGVLEGQVPEKMRVLIGEIENAYSTDIKGLVKRLSDAGFEEWAKQIEGNTTMQQALMAQLRKAYEAVQEQIRKEASRIKKDADMMWKTILLPDGTNLKQATDEMLARMTQQQDSLGRANSLIGAGVASDNVATKLAIKQLQLQMSIQRAQFALMRKMGDEKAKYLDQLAKQLELEGKVNDAERARKDAANVRKSLGLAVTEETKKQQELSNQIAKEQEESQARLYKELREWGELLASSVQSVMEASNAGNAEYYNELAKLNLTGKGGPGAGTYIVIDNEGTEDATAHYEYLDERQALERQREIEQQNAVADAWKKVMDDINQKLSDTITDQLNAMLQNQAIDANTQAVIANTQAIYDSMGQAGGGTGTATGSGAAPADAFKRDEQGFAVDDSGQLVAPVQPTEQPAESVPSSYWPLSEEQKEKALGWQEELLANYRDLSIQTETEKAEMLMETPGYAPPSFALTEEQVAAGLEKTASLYGGIADASDAATAKLLANQQTVKQGELQTDKQMTQSGQSLYAKLTQAANLYGIAYQAMSNDNLDATQKFEMIGLQAAGNAAIAALTATYSKDMTQTTTSLPVILAECLKINPIAGAAIFAALTAVLGGLMGMAASKVAKGKQEIAQVTGSSVGAGRLSTGMLTYAEGNVNEFTDPNSLTPGRSYNVDAADGKTYRAKYTGKNPSTHLTNGPEFHLVGEAGREAIIDAHTTRLMQTDDTGIWQSIQTLYNGGTLSTLRRRRSRSGVRAFKDGNLDDFDLGTEGTEMAEGTEAGFGTEQLAAFQSSLDKNNELLERALTQGIHAKFDVYGKGGLVDSYDTGKKNVTRHGERY